MEVSYRWTRDLSLASPKNWSNNGTCGIISLLLPGSHDAEGVVDPGHQLGCLDMMPPNCNGMQTGAVSGSHSLPTSRGSSPNAPPMSSHFALIACKQCSEPIFAVNTMFAFLASFGHRSTLLEFQHQTRRQIRVVFHVWAIFRVVPDMAVPPLFLNQPAIGSSDNVGGDIKHHFPGHAVGVHYRVRGRGCEVPAVPRRCTIGLLIFNGGVDGAVPRHP